MAFINEEIPQEQKDKFKFPVEISRSGRKPTLYKWVVDPKNDFYLVKASSEGGAYDGTQEKSTFYFHVYNEDVFIRATPLGNEYVEDKKMIFRWEITELVIPNKLSDRIDSIVELVVEAFKTWGYLNDGDSFFRVDVEILCDVDVRDHKESN